MTGLILEPAVCWVLTPRWSATRLEGEAEFRVGTADWVRGGSGTVQSLPQGVARIIQVSVGAPYDAFAREMALLFG